MKRGFTLLEVLLALGLLALVLTLVQGSYSGASRSRHLSGTRTREIHAAAFVLDRIAGELSSAFLSTVTPERALASRFVAGVDSDGWSSVAFATRLPALPGVLPGGEAELGYFVEKDEDGVPWLRRRESRDLDGDPEGGVPYAVLGRVMRFEVSCYDGAEWLESWDSREREEEPRLPLAVSVRIGWGDEEAGEETGETVLTTSTPLYLARPAP